MKTEFNPLEALADISEDELNEFIELQEEAPKKRRRQKTRESFVCFISFYESIKLMPERLHLRAFRVLMDYDSIRRNRLQRHQHVLCNLSSVGGSRWM